jgi:tetratricopeptide (TPR) repeat protein
MLTKEPSVMAAAEAAIVVERPTTDGAIAILNLRTQIDGQRQQAASGRLTVTGRAGLIELITLRGNLLGHIASYELAAELAEELVHDAPEDRYAFFARATTRATFHRFTDALDDLDTAERFGMEDSAVDGERAAIFQATGSYDEALAIREKAAERRAGFETLGALAGLFAELGEITTAEKLLGESRDRYRGVSPFPLAILDFQFGRMWMEHGQFVKARTWFDAACRRVPAYAAAQGHLAEVEAELGESETAAARLYPLAASSDDPDYAAQLSRILGDAGRADESSRWRQLAAARYDELVERHPEAFADHAAEFWLEAGANPNRALWLAQRNLEIRRTPRAHKLFARAAHAVDCAPARHPDRHGDAEESLR